MKKIIRHKWEAKSTIAGATTIWKCIHCGCIRYWDFDYNHVMYSYGTKIAYRAPDCIIPLTGVPYNK